MAQTSPLYLGLDLTPEECVRRYRAFYENEKIQELSRWPFWATTNPVDKAPMSMHGLSFNPPLEYFASSAKPRDMLPLVNVLLAHPDLRNVALYLQAEKFGYAVVDIEPACPKRTRDRLMSLPWHYAERSMSGKGIHLIIDCPKDLLERYPNARKAKVQDSNKTYEILLDHWVTFTREAIDPSTVPQRGTKTAEKVLKKLFSSQKKPISTEVDFDIDDPETEIEHYAAIMDNITFDGGPLYGNTYANILESKGNDQSRADFTCALLCAKALDRHMRTAYNTPMRELPPQHMGYITMQLMRQVLEKEGVWRDKYDSPRPGGTWLQTTVARAYAVACEER